MRSFLRKRTLPFLTDSHRFRFCLSLETSQRVSKRKLCQLSADRPAVSRKVDFGDFSSADPGIFWRRDLGKSIAAAVNGRFSSQSAEISLSGSSGLFVAIETEAVASTEAVDPRVRRARLSFPRASALVRPRPTRFVLLASIVCADLLVVSDTWTRQLETCSASLPPPLAFAPR